MDRSIVREIAGTDILGGLGHVAQGAPIVLFGIPYSVADGGFFLKYGLEELEIGAFWMGLKDYPYLASIHRDEKGMPVIMAIHECDVPAYCGYAYPYPYPDDDSDESRALPFE